MNIIQLLGMLLLYGFILFVFGVLVIAVIVMRRTNNGQYGPALVLIKRFPFIVDKSGQGLITNEYVIVAALKAGDTATAEKYLSPARKYGALPGDYFLMMLLAAVKADWDEAERLLQLTRQAAQTANSEDKTDWDYIQGLVQNRDQNGLLGMISTSNFAVLIDKKVDLQQK